MHDYLTYGVRYVKRVWLTVIMVSHLATFLNESLAVAPDFSINPSQQGLCFSQQMAEAGLTVRVSGLPTDIDDDRLRDKLLIHFLRSRNGGGEVLSVTPVKATPGSALITFEESRGQ